MNHDKKFLLHCCRVCGLHYKDHYPWGKDGKTPLFEICRCCRVEFGNEDHTKESADVFRVQWMEDGAEWFEKKSRPEPWNRRKQLENILTAEEVEKLLKEFMPNES